MPADPLFPDSDPTADPNAAPAPRPAGGRPKITVVITNLNQGRYLERAICSVLDQGEPGLQLIVMDGGSTDDSLDILQTYADDLTHWQSMWDSGPAEALNTALGWAGGRVFGVLDADDVYLPGAVPEALRQLEDHPWAVGHARRVDEADEELGVLPADPPTDLARHLLREDAPARRSATFYRTELLRAAGGFDSHLRLAYAFELQARLLAGGERPGVIPARVADVRDHDRSLTARAGVACGHEFADAAERHAAGLPPEQRYRLWRSCDERRRIYRTAATDGHRGPERRELWNQLLRRPWWLSRAEYRRKVLDVVEEAAAAAAPRAAPAADARRAA